MERTKDKTVLEKRLKFPLFSAALCRPLLTGSILFLLLCALFALLPQTARLFLGVSGFLFCLVFCVLSNKRDVESVRLFCFLLAVSFFALLCCEALFYVRDTVPNERLEALLSAEEVRLSATVREVGPEYSVLFVEEAEGERVGAYVCTQTGDFSVGETVSATASFRPVNEKLPHAFRYLNGYRCRYVALLSDKVETLSSSSSGLLRLRASFAQSLSSAKSHHFLRSILLAQDGTSRLLQETFQRVGASHLMALSGLHLGILVASLHFVLRSLCVHRRVRLVCSVFFALFFLFLCGAPLSLLRAFCMMVFACLAELFSRRQNSVQSLFLSAALIVFFDRGALYDAGFLLSVFATLGILLFVPFFRESFYRSSFAKTLRESGGLKKALYRVGEGAYLTFSTSVCALVFTLPVTAFVFGEVAILSPFWGVFLIPLFTVLLSVSVLFLLLSFFGVMVLAPLFAFLTDALCRLFFSVSEGFAHFSPTLVLEPETVILSSAILILFVLFCLYYRVKMRVFLLSIPLFFALSYATKLILSLL